MLAGIAVSAADPSGLWGMRKEAFASSAAKLDGGSNELIKSVVADFETSEGRSAVQRRFASGLPVPRRLTSLSVPSRICKTYRDS